MNLPYEAFIGLRYLRAKRRNRTISFNTLISIIGVTIGVAALIATLGIMTGFKEDLQAKILGTNSHIIVTTRTGEPIKDYATLTDKVAAVPEVVAATPFIFKQVLLTSESGSHGVVLRGIDVRREPTVTEIAKTLRAGRLEELDQPPGAPPLLLPGIIIGKELALRLGVFMGDRLNVVSPVGPLSALGMLPKVRSYRVVGVFESGMYEYDSSLVYVSIKQAQEFFNMGDAVTGIEVKVADIFAADRIAQAIEHAIGFPYWARDWMKLNKNLFSALKLEKFMMFILLVLVVIVASFNIVSTLTMIVVEKHREIAILKAMGATGQAVMRIFILHGLVIGIVGTVIGIPLGYSFCWAIQTFYTLPGDVYYLSRIPVNIKIVHVLKGVTLEIKRGELVAIVGASGVGKTTLLHILGTLDRPTSGTVRFDGNDLSALDDQALAEFRNRKVGFVFQFHHLLPEFTALENVMLPALIRRHDQAKARAAAEAVLKEVGLEHRLAHRIGELSGGEQQRVAVARALVLRPDLVLADEPTGNLDTHTGEEVFKLMRDLNRAKGITFVIVTHNEALSRQADRIIRMVDGKIA